MKRNLMKSIGQCGRVITALTVAHFQLLLVACFAAACGLGRLRTYSLDASGTSL